MIAKAAGYSIFLSVIFFPLVARDCYGSGIQYILDSKFIPAGSDSISMSRWPMGVEHCK